MNATFNLGLSAMLMFAAAKGAAPGKPKVARTPEEAVRMLGQAGKDGDLDTVRALLSDHDRILLDAMNSTEKAVAELEIALDKILGKRTDEQRIHAVGFFPDHKGKPEFGMYGSLKERLLGLDGMQIRSIVKKELRGDRSVVLTLQGIGIGESIFGGIVGDVMLYKFTAIHDGTGWRLLMWIGDSDGRLIEPSAGSAESCRKRTEEAKAHILHVARLVNEGKITKYDDTWPALQDRLRAGEPPPPPPDKKESFVVVHVDSTIQIQSSTKRHISEVVVDEARFRVNPLINDPSRLLLTGLRPGKAKLTITDVNKEKETLDIVVRRLIELPVGVDDVVALPDPIAKIVNDNDKVARVALLPADASRLQVNALAVGKTLCTLTDKAGKAEEYDIVIVKPDVAIVIGQSEHIRPASRKGIIRVIVEHQRLVAVEPGMTVLLKGGIRRLEMFVDPVKPATVATVEGEFISVAVKALRVGVTRVTLTDVEGKGETFVIGVVPKK